MIIDTPNSVLMHLDLLKSEGVTGIIRYDDRFSSWKQMSTREAHAILEAGFELGVVYEHTAAPSGHGLGYADACHSLAQAVARGQPSGSAIYYAVDHDASMSQIRNDVLPYFTGVAKAHAENDKVKLKFGCYGSGQTNSALLEHYPDLLPWITCSRGFSGSAAFLHAGRQVLFQEHCDRKLRGLDVDINVANRADWGQFSINKPVPDKPPAMPAWPASGGSQDGIASWYADGTNADETPVDNATDMTVAHRSLAFGTKLKITRRDTGVSVLASVHDRGPYSGGRILDCRPAVAKALNMIDCGVCNVHLELAE